MENNKKFLVIDSNDLPADVILDLSALKVEQGKNVYDYRNKYVIIVNFMTPNVQTWQCVVSRMYWDSIYNYIKSKESTGDRIHYYTILPF